MRPALVVIAVLVAFLLGAAVEHVAGVPFGLLDAPGAPPRAALVPAPETGNTAVPRGSNVRGQEDALRNDTPQGARTDFQRCVTTMIMRREPESEARTVCQKIMAGIGG